MSRQIDVVANRNATKWTRKEKLGRLAWALCKPLFCFSPRIFWAWRRMLLRLFGAEIGRGAHIYPSVRVTIPWNLTIGEEAAIGDCAILYALGPIRVGARATISQYAHLCAGTHDWKDPTMPLGKEPIIVEDDVWVCADAFVGPGVTIGRRAIVAARGVAMKDVDPHSIVGGNPAVKFGERAS